MADQPWYELPPEIARVLRPALPDVANEMIEAVRTVPAYSRPIDGAFGAGVRAGVEEALRHFLAEIEAGRSVPRQDVYVALGRGEMRSGRSLDSLLSAYRIGARVAWRRFAAVGVAAGLEPDTLYLLAESIFAYIDVLSAESAEGHALEQSAVAGEAELRRRRLVRTLVREPPAEAGAVENAAREAGWPLPKRIAVIAIEGPGRESAASHLPPDAISDTMGEMVIAVLGDPEGLGRRAAIERAVADAGAFAGLGTTVEWPAAAISLARARAALALTGSGPAVIAAREQVGLLLLRSDPRLAAELARDRLAPLAELSPRQRNRLIATLRRMAGRARAADRGRGAPRRAPPDRALPARAAAGAVRRRARGPRRALLARARAAGEGRGRGAGGASLDGRLGLRYRLGLGLGNTDLGSESAGRELVVPNVRDGDLIAARVVPAELDHLGTVPVAVPVSHALKPRHLEDLVAVVAGVVNRVRRRAVAQRQRRHTHDLVSQRVLAPDCRVPLDVNHPCHDYAPTSARIAPGPSALLPSPSLAAPTRIAILPRCLLSRSSWCASATPSNPIVCHSTGRIFDSSISSLALVASQALAKCEPTISFWRIHRYLTSKSSS